MMMYWWTTFAILIVALFLSLVMAIIPISIFAATTSTVDQIFIGWTAGGAGLDIVTDILRKFTSHVEQAHFIKTYQFKFSLDNSIRTTLADSDQFLEKIHIRRYHVPLNFHDHRRYPASIDNIWRNPRSSRREPHMDGILAVG